MKTYTPVRVTAEGERLGQVGVIVAMPDAQKRYTVQFDDGSTALFTIKQIQPL